MKELLEKLLALANEWEAQADSGKSSPSAPNELASLYDAADDLRKLVEDYKVEVSDVQNSSR